MVDVSIPTPHLEHLKGTMIWCEDKDTYDAVQFRLLEMGIKWARGDSHYINYFHKGGSSLIVGEGLKMSGGNTRSSSYYKSITPSQIGLERFVIYDTVDYSVKGAKWVTGKNDAKFNVATNPKGDNYLYDFYSQTSNGLLQPKNKKKLMVFTPNPQTSK